MYIYIWKLYNVQNFSSWCVFWEITCNYAEGIITLYISGMSSHCFFVEHLNLLHSVNYKKLRYYDYFEKKTDFLWSFYWEKCISLLKTSWPTQRCRASVNILKGTWKMYDFIVLTRFCLKHVPADSVKSRYKKRKKNWYLVVKRIEITATGNGGRMTGKRYVSAICLIFVLKYRYLTVKIAVIHITFNLFFHTEILSDILWFSDWLYHS